MRKLRYTKIHIYIIAFFLFCSLMYGLQRIFGFIIFPDEFGYWASAAKLAGYDWSEAASLGSYYSYGYSLVLFPILLLVKSSVGAYRVAVALNTIGLFIAFYLIFRISHRIFPQMNRNIMCVFAAIACFYPPWIFYMETTLVETVIVVVYVIVCYTMLSYFEKPVIWKLGILMLMLLYLYSLHMRNIAIVLAAAGILVLFHWLRSKHKREIIIIFVTLVLGCLLVSFVKEMVQDAIYGQSDNLSINDYSGQLYKLKMLFSLSGCLKFLGSLLGKIYYLCVSSFGLFFFGIIFLIRKIFLWKKKDYRWFFYAFLLLASVGEILVNAIYNIEPYGRIDALIYGRYDEHILPPVMLLGLLEIYRKKETAKRFNRHTAFLIVFCLIGTGILQFIIAKEELTNINGGYFISGMSYLLRYIPCNPSNYLWKAFLCSLILSGIILICVRLFRRFPYGIWIIYSIIIIEIFLGISLNEHYTYRFNIISYGNEMIVSTIKEEMKEQRRIVCIGDDGYENFVSILQFSMRDSELVFLDIKDIDSLHADDLVVVSTSIDTKDKLRKQYSEYKACGAFQLFYNMKM